MRREFGSIAETERGRSYRVQWTENGKRRSHRVKGTRRDASDYLASVQAGIEGVPEASPILSIGGRWWSPRFPSSRPRRSRTTATRGVCSNPL